MRKAETWGGGGERLSKIEKTQKPRRNQRWGRIQSLRNRDWRSDAGATAGGKLGGSGRDRESRTVRVRVGGAGGRREEKRKRRK